MRAVLLDVGDGFVACGVQLGIEVHGDDEDEAHVAFIEACAETVNTVCVTHRVDLATALGRGAPFVSEEAGKDIADRDFPIEFIGSA